MIEEQAKACGASTGSAVHIARELAPNMHVVKLICTLTAVLLLEGCQLNTIRPLRDPDRLEYLAGKPLPASSQSWRWQGNSRDITLPGSASQQKQTLTKLLAHTSEAEPTAMLLAANSALRLKQLEDAGFLYNAAQVRRAHDLMRFPPLATEAPWLKRMDALHVDIGRQVNTALLDNPRTYARLARRMASWDCTTGKDYLPAWRAQRREPGEDCRVLTRERARALQDAATLMAIPSYAESARLVRYYLNGSASVRALPGLRQQYQAALNEMQRIERSKGLSGLSTRMR